MKKVFTKGIEFYKKYEQRIIIALAFIIGSGCSFVVGMMASDIWYQPAIVIEHTPVQIVQADDGNSMAKQDSRNISDSSDSQKKTCAYVGSKNSTKYYPPTCSFAKRISKENLRCFASDEDAKQKGYVRSTACK